LSQISVGDYLFEVSFPDPLAVPRDATAGKLHMPFLYGLLAANRSFGTLSEWHFRTDVRGHSKPASKGRN
jgi:hypothetical protein